MKKIVLFSIFLICSNQVLAQSSLNSREIRLYKELLNKKYQNQQDLKGVGLEFVGSLQIEETSSQKDNQKIKEKKFFTYIRNCGKVSLPELDEKQMKNARQGSSLTIRFKESRSCIVNEWKLN